MRWHRSEVIYNHPMSDHPAPPPPQPPPSQPSPPPEPVTEFHIGEEFGTGKRKLPPVGIVLICLAAVALILVIFASNGPPNPHRPRSPAFLASAQTTVP